MRLMIGFMVQRLQASKTSVEPRGDCPLTVAIAPFGMLT